MASHIKIGFSRFKGQSTTIKYMPASWSQIGIRAFAGFLVFFQLRYGIIRKNNDGDGCGPIRKTRASPGGVPMGPPAAHHNEGECKSFWRLLLKIYLERCLRGTKKKNDFHYIYQPKTHIFRCIQQQLLSW